jgi:RND superfamily putative drug exporter
MSRFLDRLGRACARHHWRALSLWLVGLLAVLALASGVGGKPVDDFRMPNSDAQRAFDVLQREFHAESGSRAYLVFHGSAASLTDPAIASAVRDTVARVELLPHVTGVTDPFAPGAISKDGTIARAEVRYDRSTADVGRTGYDELRDVVRPMRASGLVVEIGGPLSVWEQSSGSTEWIGVLVAMVVLTLVFGSLLAMWLPLALAIVALVVGQLLVAVLAGIVNVPSSTPQLVTMIGLGVALDYSLFIVSRYLDRVRAGADPDVAAGHAAGTAGLAVVFAGSTVIVAICGLALSGIWAVGVMGFAVAIVAAVTIAAAVTLLPAMLGFLGRHANASRFRGLQRTTARETNVARRWAGAVVRRPVLATVGALVALVVLASPVLALHLGQTDSGTSPPSTSQRKAFDLLAHGFGPGFNGPLLVVVQGAGVAHPDALARIAQTIGHEPGIVGVAAAQTNSARTVAVLQAVPQWSPHADATATLVRRLRADVAGPARAANLRVFVGGQTAAFVDVADQMQSRLPILIAAVVAVSFVLLTAGFRSLVVPAKAAVMNVLSIGVGYGVLVAIFQWGWGRSVIGLHETVPIVAWVPLLMFAILFGLSMDYEVFLISAIRDAYRRTGDNRAAVVDGLASTASIITAAAAIMLSVFGAFIFFPDPVVKMVGLGLAVSILVDATVVRMLLIPAAMILLGDANWWLPRWLDRLLPTVDFEGEDAPPLAVCAPPPLADDQPEPSLVTIDAAPTGDLVAARPR